MGSELAERVPDELVEGGDGIRDLCENALGVALAEAKAQKRLKGLLPYIGSSWTDGATVRRAVGVEEARQGSRARDDEPALVDGEMMGSAERNEIVGVMVATF
jgi:hypothetical protein